MEASQTPSQPVLERIKELEAERDRILSEAKSDALTKAREAVTILKALGLRYELVEAGKRPKTKRKSKGGPCSICQFETSPTHDARKHRLQGELKQPFGDDELAALGLAKVA